MKIDILEVFIRAGKITWKYKILWIFGILAGCGRSGGSSSNSSSRSSSGSGSGDSPIDPQMLNQFEGFVQRMQIWFEQNTWIVFAIFSFLLIAFILKICFSLIGTAGLARGVLKAERGAESLQFGELFGESVDYFWSLLGAALTVWGPYYIFLIAAVIMGILPSVQNGGITESTFSDEASGSILLMMLLICCCAFPVSILLSLYHTQVKRSILVEEMGVFKSLSRGLDVLMQNFIPMLIIGIVIGVAGFIINLLLTIPLLLLLLPLMISFMQGNINSWQPFMAVGLFMLCYVPVLWFINGILMTYFESVWTLAYMQVTIPQKRDSLSFEANA